uniref:Uncharacterized protein n=1 Tax=Micrurus lemniscatus lemniscatus TaxID=129467 RepID=A0A2D4ING9_MICLE
MTIPIRHGVLPSLRIRCHMHRRIVPHPSRLLVLKIHGLWHRTRASHNSELLSLAPNPAHIAIQKHANANRLIDKHLYGKITAIHVPLVYSHAGHLTMKIVWLPRPRNGDEHHARESDITDMEICSFTVIPRFIYFNMSLLKQKYCSPKGIVNSGHNRGRDN